MAQRITNSTGSGAGSGRQRGKPVKIQKSFPWGFVLGSTALALALISILVFAVLNRGSGSVDAVEEADRIPGITVAPAGEQDDRSHRGGPIKYGAVPPNTGDHNAAWQNCGVYPEQIPTEHALHALEHGAVWITYQPSLPASQVEDLREKADKSYMLMSPLPGQQSPITLTAWGRTLNVPSADDERVDTFITNFRQGPQTPEPGASCTGGVSATGTTPVA